MTCGPRTGILVQRLSPRTITLHIFCSKRSSVNLHCMFPLMYDDALWSWLLLSVFAFLWDCTVLDNVSMLLYCLNCFLFYSCAYKSYMFRSHCDLCYRLCAYTHTKQSSGIADFCIFAWCLSHFLFFQPLPWKHSYGCLMTNYFNYM